MKKIKKVSELTNNQYTTTYKVDCGMFQVDAELYSSEFEMKDLSNKLFSCDIQDIDLEFSIYGKRCNYDGFKELYEKLYGKDSYKDFSKEIVDHIEAEHFKLSDRPYLQNISVDKAKEYLSELLTTSTYATNITMVNGKKIVYVDKWNIVELAKVAEPNKTHEVKCKRAGSSSDKEYTHSIFDLDGYWVGE